MTLQHPGLVTDPLTRAQAEPADRVPLPQLLKNRDRDRLQRYKEHLDFYNGQQWTGRTSANDRRRRKTYNYVQSVIDKTASYVLTGSQLSVRPHTDAHEDAARAAEAELALIAENNSLEILDYVTEIDTAVLGDGAFELAWNAEEARVTVTAPDVAGIFVWTHPTDPLSIRRLAKRYRLARSDIFATWGVTTGTDPEAIVEEWTDQAHAVWIGDSAAPAVFEPNPYGFVPFIVYPNVARPKTNWGRSDVEVMIEPARELNEEATRLSNIVDLSGFPIAVVSGTQVGDLAAEAGAIWELPDEKARADVLDLLKNGAVHQHIEYLDKVLQVFNDVAETPRSAFGSIERELSGVALEVDLLPLIQKVARKRAIRTTAYVRRATMALTILDQYAGTNHAAAGIPVVSWAPPTPRDRARDTEVEAVRIQNRLTSHESAIERLGDSDPDEEIERIRAEKDLYPTEVTNNESVDTEE